MINLFTLAANDQSIVYLSRIFGPMGNLFPPPPPGVNLPALLGAMFTVFNSVVLTIGALIVVYITIVGVLTTAHEGEFMGRHGQGLWTPIKIVLGIAALVPTGSGYSAIQLVMMWVIIQGIGAADGLWTRVLQYNNLFGNPANPTVPSGAANNNMTMLFQALTCQATAMGANANPQPGGGSGGYFCYNSQDPFCNPTSSNSDPVTQMATFLAPGSGDTWNNGTPTIQFGPSGACGAMTICNDGMTTPGLCDTSSSGGGPASSGATSLACATCKAQKAALATIVPTLMNIANAFATTDYDYRAFVNNVNSAAPPAVTDYCAAKGLTSAQCCNGGAAAGCYTGFPSPDYSAGGGIDTKNASDTAVQQIYWPFALSKMAANQNFVATSAVEYTSQLQKAVNDFMNAQGTNLPPAVSDKSQYGWIFAGAYYYSLASQSDKNASAAYPVFSITNSASNTNLLGNSNPPLNSMRVNDTAAGNLISYLQQQAAGGVAASNVPAQMGGVSSALNSLASSIMTSFMGTVSGAGSNVNPLSAVQQLGRNILIAVDVTTAVLFVVTTILAILGYFSAFILGTGFNNPIGPALSTVYMLLGPIILLFLGLMYTFGGLLAVYTPLIPYIIFFLGAIGWMISTIETIVAAPLVALGILGKGQGHEILGKAEPALMLLFSVFLRPTLMIFGLMAGMLLSVVVVMMINSTYGGVIGTISRYPGITELIFFLATYVFLILTALNKSFSLIHVVPEKVLRWIGGGGEQYGEEQSMAGIKGEVSGAGAGGGQAARQAGGKEGVESAKAAGKEVKESRAAQSATGGQVTGGSGKSGGGQAQS